MLVTKIKNFYFNGTLLRYERMLRLSQTRGITMSNFPARAFKSLEILSNNSDVI